MKSVIIPATLAALVLLSSVKKNVNGEVSRKGYTVDTTVTNVSFIDKAGKKHPLIDVTKKVNMVVLWASWCSPCRMEIPNLKEIYGKADTTKLRLISISIDKDRDAWLKAMNEENMPWAQVLAEGDNLTSLKKQFGFKGIPQIYFLDPKGNILSGYTGFHYDNNVGLTALVKRLVEN